MAGALEVKLKGFDSVERLLNQLPVKMRNKHLRRATNQAIAVVRNDIKSTAPVRGGDSRSYRRGQKRPKPGRLRRLVRSKARRGKKGYLKASLFYPTPVGTSGNDPKNAFYWRFVEFGTKHMPARHFIDRSVKRTFKRVLRKYVDNVRVGVREEIRKAGRGAT